MHILLRMPVYVCKKKIMEVLHTTTKETMNVELQSSKSTQAVVKVNGSRTLNKAWQIYVYFVILTE